MLSETDYEKYLNQGYEKYQFGEYKEALGNFSMATMISQKKNLIEEECISIKMEATVLYRLANYQEADKKFTIALDIAIKNNFKMQQCRIYNHLIALYEMLNDYKKAKDCIDKGYELAILLNDTHSLAKILNSKGVYFHIFGNDEDAINCFREAIVNYEKSNDIRGMGTSYNLIAGYYYVLEDYDEALNYYLKANEIGIALSDFHIIALSKCRMGLIFYKKNDSKRAEEILEDPLFFEEKLENKKIVVEIYYVKGLISKSLGQKDTAKQNFEEAIHLASSIGAKYLTARIYKELGILFLEEGDITNSYDNLKKCIDNFNNIREKIEDFNLRKQFKDSFQDILELIWSLTKIIDNLKIEEDLSEIKYIGIMVQNLCKITNNHSTDYALKLQTKLITKSLFSKFSDLKSKKDVLEKQKINFETERKNLENENRELSKKIEFLKEKIKIFEKKFEDIKKKPEKYDGLEKDYLKNFINTEVWEDSKTRLINYYFSNVFNNLLEKSKNDLIFMMTIFNIMNSGYEICAFLLTKVVERELRSTIFKKFKIHWKKKLNKCDFHTSIKDSNFLDSRPDFKKSILKTNNIFRDYLDDRNSLTLGSIRAILQELSSYCKRGENKSLVLGWEQQFLLAFQDNICSSVYNILDGLHMEIKSKKDSIRFIDLRNLVSHADDVDPEIRNYKEVQFDSSFIEMLLNFLTIKKPKLLILICGIKPNYLDNN